MKVYRTEDASFEPLQGKTIAILGYGLQGEAQALCLRDSGLNVIVGGRPGKSMESAKSAGFATDSVVEAVKASNVIFLLVPDSAHSEVFDQFKQFMSGKTLVVAHGSSLHFGWIKPPSNCDVVLVAPHGNARTVRESYISKKGVPAAFAVHQNWSGAAKKTVLAICSALRFILAGVYECTVKDEAVCDLFGEQAVLCGGAAELVRQAYNTLVDRGYSKEMAYLVCLYELEMITESYNSHGLDGMLERISDAARFGAVKNASAVVGPQVRDAMERVLDEVENGSFAVEFVKEKNTGYQKSFEGLEAEKAAGINRVGAKIRREFDL